MKKNTFKVLFYIRGNRINKDGNVSVMIRITVDGEMEQLNSKLVVNPEIWDAKTGRAIGRSAKVLELNNREIPQYSSQSLNSYDCFVADTD